MSGTRAGAPRRLALLAEGSFSPLDAKTAVGVLRYRTADVAAVLDSTQAGRTAEACVGVGGGVPVVATLDEAARAGANALLVGVAPAGGRLPPPFEAAVLGALERGWDVISGLHVFLADDPRFAAVAARTGATIHDVRRPSPAHSVGLARAAGVPALVVLTVGTDCNVGKMTAALEVERDLTARGTRARFVATGQTGIMIAGRGVPVDAVVSDFVAGAVESAVLEAAEGADVVVVEGQGALHHPAFSAVTLGLIHGACPAALILCHHLGRARMRIGGAGEDGPPLPTPAAAREAHERAASWVRPAATIGVALNTLGASETEARAACAGLARELDLPVTDPIRFGATPLAEAVLNLRRAAAAR